MIRHTKNEDRFYADSAKPVFRGCSTSAVGFNREISLVTLDRLLLRRTTLDGSAVGVNPASVPIVPPGPGAFVAHRAVAGGFARQLPAAPVHIVGIEAGIVNRVAPPSSRASSESYHRWPACFL